MKQIKNYLNNNILFLSLLCIDIISVTIAFIFAYFLRDKGIFRIYLDSVQPIEVYLRALPMAAIILSLTFSLFGLYDRKNRITAFSETYTAIKGTTFWILLIMAGSYITKFDYSRIIVVLFYTFTLFFITVNRLITRQVFARFDSFGRTNVLIVGTGKSAKEIALKLKEYKSAGLNFAGFITNDFSKKNLPQAVGKINDLYKLIKKLNIHEVYVADPSLSYEKILNIVAKCPNTNAQFKITSNIFKLVTGNVNIADLERIPSLDISRGYFPLWKTVIKRLFDSVFALLILIITLPIWLIIIIVIKIDSNGEAILKQIRIGKAGKSFKMYKFRTLYKDKKNKINPVTKNDERITRVGKFLRSTSLDELPQLVNILKGEMSIVGPRPELPYVVKNYNSWEKRRLLIKPGLTGLWQILGRKDLPLSENLEYDFYYLSNHSFLLDLAIILKTIPQVILRKGAY